MHTTHASVVWLDEGGSDLAILDDQGIPLPSHAAEDGRAVKAQVQCLGKRAGRVSQEPDLVTECFNQRPISRERDRHCNLPWTPWWGRAGHPRPSCLLFRKAQLATKEDAETTIGGKKKGGYRRAHTKGSLTLTTKTWPASASRGWLM
jgi:hypothetical protein